MFKKIIWLSIMASLLVHASRERSPESHKENLRCFDGQVSFIQRKNGLYYSALNNKFLTKEEASEDSCKKQYLSSNRSVVACTSKEDIIKTINSLHNNKKILYPTCIIIKEKLELTLSNHTLLGSTNTYYHIRYKGNSLYIPKYSMQKNKHINKKKYKSHKRIKHTKNKIHKRYKHSKNKTHKRYKHSKKYNKRTTYKHPKKYNKIKKHTKLYTQKKTTKHTKKSYKKNNYQESQHLNNNYVYKCLGSHGNVNISATDDYSISMASDILWRMCQKLKTEDEVCKIRDCYKLIK